MRVYLFIYLFIYLLGCKGDRNTQDKSRNQKPVKADIILNNCLKKSDSLLVNEFIKKFIVEIDNNQVNLLSSKFIYPFHLFDITINSKSHFVDEWFKNEKVKNYLTLDEYDEDENYLGKGTFQDNNIFYEKEAKSVDCYYVQYFIGDKIFIIKKKNSDLKIVQINGVG